MKSATRLLVRADDLGSFRGANRAIGQLLQGPVVRTAGIMAPSPHVGEAAKLVRGRRGVCLGLHMTLNSEWENARWRPVLPAAQVSCLVEPDGTLKRTPHALHEAGADFSQMLAEIAAQLAQVRGAGVEVGYLDEHMCFGWVHEPDHPERRFAPELAAFAAREGIRCFGTVETAEGVMTAVDDHPLRRLSFGAGPLTTARAVAALERAAEQGGDWLWVAHPAMRDAETEAVHLAAEPAGRVAESRDAEWRALADPALAAACARLGIACISPDDL